MVMLNVSPEVAEQLHAFAREHGYEDESAALQALLDKTAAGAKARKDPYEVLLRLRATCDLEPFEGAFDDVRDRSPWREVDL